MGKPEEFSGILYWQQDAEALLIISRLGPENLLIK